MEWIHEYEIGKMIDAALLEKNGDYRVCIDIPDTRYGIFMLYEIVFDFFNNYWCRGAHDGLYLQVNFGKEKFFIPQMDFTSTELTLHAIEAIAKKMFQRKRRKELAKYMEKNYLKAECDNGCITAINIYKNMPKKRQESEAGQKIREYLTAMSEFIVLWDLEMQLTKQLRDFLQLDCVPPEILEKIFSAKYDSMPVEIKSYMLDAIMRTEKRESNEFSL